MPGRKEHLKVGAAIGGTAAAGSYLTDYLTVCNQYNQQGGTPPKFDWLEFLGTTILGVGAGAVGGALPDVLEPALHSHHRKTMHSLTTGAALTTVVASNQNEMSRVQKSLVNAFSAGYLSHLALDSETPRGIPLI